MRDRDTMDGADKTPDPDKTRGTDKTRGSGTWRERRDDTAT
jgi:hypothetical protein